jgi:hypothetical protein
MFEMGNVVMKTDSNSAESLHGRLFLPALAAASLL